MARPSACNFRLGRRAFLRAAGLWGAGLALPAGAVALESRRFSADGHGVEKAGVLMGTFVTLKAVCPSRSQGEDALEEAWREMARLGRLLDWRRSYSAVGALNEAGRLRRAPRELYHNLVLARAYHRLTCGAFDVTLLPVLREMRRSFYEEGRAARPDEIEDALGLADMGRLELDGRDVRLGRAGMGITLDGIAKGYVVDRGLAALRRRGVENALVAAGGDIRACSAPAAGRRWRIGVRDPWREDGYLAVITLDNGGVATSGGYEVSYGPEPWQHHLIDPASGAPATRCAGITVRTTTAADADALATALFVLEPHQALKLADSMRGTACLIVDHNRRQLRSRGWA